MSGRRDSLTGPIRVSEDGRYFVGADGQPLFWLGDTQWELFRLFRLDDIRRILDSRQALGFTCLQIMLVGVDPLANVEGELPWLDGDPARPNEKYFAHVDRAVELCAGYEMALVVGVYHSVRMAGRVNPENARPWARWVAQRYGGTPGIVWSMYPRALPEEVGLCRELAAGLRDGAGGAGLITVHPDPSPASSGSIVHEEDWLAFNSIQTHRHVDLVRPMVAEDRARRPVKPVVMAEGAYEGGTGYGFDVTPLWLRRQAYYSYLAGGHHAYGHEDFWRIRPSWPEALDAAGARQMGVLKKVFIERQEWWRLTPDPALLASGGCTGGRVLTLAARHPEGRWAVVYAAGPTRFSIDVDGLGAGRRLDAVWVDPRTGQALGRMPCRSVGRQAFATPDGWPDGVCVLEP